jgi:hypothetical protein
VRGGGFQEKDSEMKVLKEVAETKVRKICLPFFWLESGLPNSVEMKHRNEYGQEMLWSVQPDRDLGLPGQFDFDIWTVIQQVLKSSGREKIGWDDEGLKLGSAKDLLKTLSRPADAKWQKYLQRSLERLLSTGGLYKTASGGSGSKIQALSRVSWNSELDSKGKEIDTWFWIWPTESSYLPNVHLVKATAEELAHWHIVEKKNYRSGLSLV